MYVRFLLDTWAPQTLFRLNRQLGRLQASSDGLGLPEAAVQPQAASLDTLREGACAAAQEVLDRAFAATMKECFESSLQPLKKAMVELLSSTPSGTSVLQTLQLKLLEETAQSVHATSVLVARDARAALAGDTSAFKLGRFPAFIDAVMARLDTQAQMSKADLAAALGAKRGAWLSQLLREAAASVPSEGWVESCAEERIQLRAQMGRWTR